MPSPLSIPDALSLTIGAVIHLQIERKLSAMQESQRLFIALSPPRATRQALTHLRDSLTPKISGHPISSNNFHITLAFLGRVPLARHNELQLILQNTPQREGQIVLDTIGTFPQAGVIWAGCRGQNPLLEILAVDIRKMLLAHDFAFDRKPFLTHVTLFKKAQPHHQTIEPPIIWTLARPQLYASISTPQGMVYQIMK